MVATKHGVHGKTIDSIYSDKNSIFKDTILGLCCAHDTENTEIKGIRKYSNSQYFF